MKIIVNGLGIIGASLCASLRAAGHEVYGRNRSREPIGYALEHGYIDGEATSYDGAEVIFLALPPEITLRELTQGRFPDGAIVSDICGVKVAAEEAVYAERRNYRYVGTHPMAGKETSGIRSASPNLFARANLVVTVSERTDASAVSVVRRLAKDMGFGKITTCTAQEHDRMIAVTSQLAHVVANAYVRSETARSAHGFTGGSFQDMTRVAGVDEEMWTQLYLYNRENLLAETDGLIRRLEEYRDALAAGDGEKLRGLLREGRLAREEYLKKQ